MNALVYVSIDQGIHKGKVKLLQMKKRKKTTWVFFFHKHSKWNVWLDIFVERKPFFLKSVMYIVYILYKK